MRRLAIAALLSTSAFLAAPAVVSASEGLDDARTLEGEFVADTNSIRAEHGLASLPIEPDLVTKARDWSATMAEAGEIWHSDLRDGVTIEWQRLGENVGRGGSVSALQDAFVASPTHYENIVDPQWDAVGIGVTVDEHDTIYVAVEFVQYPASPADPPADDDAESPEPAADDHTLSPAADASLPDPAPAASPALEPEGSEGSASSPDAEPSAHLDAVLRQLRLLDG